MAGRSPRPTSEPRSFATPWASRWAPAPTPTPFERSAASMWKWKRLMVPKTFSPSCAMERLLLAEARGGWPPSGYLGSGYGERPVRAGEVMLAAVGSVAIAAAVHFAGGGDLVFAVVDAD